MVGQTISHYKVLEKIGEGGMGEVYLAEDQTLDRKVALKFLPDFMQQDPVAEKRFLREAKSAAALDHPFICNIYEAGVEDGKSFISMEYVRGENLKDKLEQGLLSLKDALEMATEIAEALETAHEANIVHRDLKPSNIMLTPDGHVKVMDFGLAKQLFPSRDTDAQEQAITAGLTKTGITLGTLAYMSPEQLRGDPVDTRSDIFSFGIVLYEMLTGTDPFQRPQPMETASAILKDDPPLLSRYLNEVPPFLERVMGKMLAKGPDSRYQGVHDVGTDLRQLVREIAEPTQAGRDSFTGTTRERSEPRKSRQEMIAWGVAGLWAIALVIALITLWPNPPVEQSPVRLPFQLSADQFFGIGNPSGAMLSPNGKQLAYVVVSGDNRQLYVRSLDQLEATALPGTEGADTPFFSPDGQWLGFSADGKLKKIPVSRGAVMTLCDISGRKGASWGPDGTIIFARGGTEPLWRVPAAGGTPEQITSLDIEKGEDAHRHPWFLPDGKSVLFSAGVTNKFQEANIEVLSLETGERKVLHEGGYFARYLPTGHLVFMQESTLFSVPFDLERLELTGSPAPVLEGIWTNMVVTPNTLFPRMEFLSICQGGNPRVRRARWSG